LPIRKPPGPISPRKAVDPPSGANGTRSGATVGDFPNGVVARIVKSAGAKNRLGLETTAPVRFSGSGAVASPDCGALTPVPTDPPATVTPRCDNVAAIKSFGVATAANIGSAVVTVLGNGGGSVRCSDAAVPPAMSTPVASAAVIAVLAIVVPPLSPVRAGIQLVSSLLTADAPLPDREWANTTKPRRTCLPAVSVIETAID
jgi:hypothetical protein